MLPSFFRSRLSTTREKKTTKQLSIIRFVPSILQHTAHVFFRSHDMHPDESLIKFIESI